MKPVSYSILSVCTILGLLAINGCNAVTQARKSAGRAQRMNQLKQLSLAYQEYHDMHRRGPNNWDELQSVASGAPAVQELRQAGYEVFFGYSFKDISIGTSNCIMAHNPADVETGGEVVMMDGAAMYMSAADLKKALELRATIKKP